MSKLNWMTLTYLLPLILMVSKPNQTTLFKNVWLEHLWKRVLTEDGFKILKKLKEPLYFKNICQTVVVFKNGFVRVELLELKWLSLDLSVLTNKNPNSLTLQKPQSKVYKTSFRSNKLNAGQSWNTSSTYSTIASLANISSPDHLILHWP